MSERTLRSLQPGRKRTGETFLLVVLITLVALPGKIGSALGQENIPRVGIMIVDAVSDAPAAGDRSEILLNTLAHYGWIDGENVLFELRNPEGDPPQFEQVALELVASGVDVIYADSSPALRAAITATDEIPIVASDFTTDPVAAGYIRSYARPGGNVTGVFLDAPAFSGTWLEMLKEIVPELTRVAVLWDPSPGDAHLRAIRTIAPTFDMELQIIEIRKPEDIDSARSKFRKRPQAMVILPSPMTYAETARLVALAADNKLPAVSIFPEFAVAGGVIAYGPEQFAEVDRVVDLVSKVLNGAKPADLPIERTTKYQLVVNLKAAELLDISIPQTVLLRADEVIR